MENIKSILNLIEPLLVELTEKYKNKLIETGKVFQRTDANGIKVKYSEPYSEREITLMCENYKYSLHMDLVKALTNYIVETDTIKDITFKKSGVIIVSFTVIRNNEVFNFNTELIIAGGYNIQVIHYRYLVKTKLSRIENNLYFKTYKSKSDLNKRVEEYKNRMNIQLELLEKYKLMSMEQHYVEFHKLKSIPSYAINNDSIKKMRVGFCESDIECCKKEINKILIKISKL